MAIASVFEQQFNPDDIELIVVNDGSTDNSAEILHSFGDRIRVIDQTNRGPAAARNTGVAAAHGEYLAFLDADDAWLPRKLATMVPILDRIDGRTGVLGRDPDRRKRSARR